jgi:NADH:ubiquinone oxidoreductase subunit 3 (subunit A)
MVALLVGIVFIVFAVYAVLPVAWSLQWWPAVLQFIKGGIPIFAFFIGLLAVFIGIADIKDRIEAKKEEEKEKQEQEAKPE